MSTGIEQARSRQAGSLTIGAMLRSRVAQHPDRIAIVDRERRSSFTTFNIGVNQLAAVLRTLSIGRGDRLAILSENRFEYLEMILAAGKLGAVTCALNSRLTHAERLHCVRLTSPQASVVSPGYLSSALRLGAVLGDIILLGEDYEQRLAGACGDEREDIAEAEDGLVILHTSGTTGNPTGALISHRAQRARMNASCVDFGLTPMIEERRTEHAPFC